MWRGLGIQGGKDHAGVRLGSDVTAGRCAEDGVSVSPVETAEKTLLGTV